MDPGEDRMRLGLLLIDMGELIVAFERDRQRHHQVVAELKVAAGLPPMRPLGIVVDQGMHRASGQ